MLDQSFSYENFRIILDVENRKGLYLEDKQFFKDDIFKESREKSNEIIEKNREIREEGKRLKKFIGAKDYTRIDQLKGEKEALIIEREKKLDLILTELSRKANKDTYRINIEKGHIKFGKQLYHSESKAEDYFVLKQLQRNIYKTFKVKQSERRTIISQLKHLLSDGFPKLIIRTDIESFYESIPHKKLISKIEDNSLLSFPSKKIIKDILNQYWKLLLTDGIKNVTDERVGIPRGIGVSAYLSELFLRDIDNRIKSLPNVTYYSRYVDDIIIIFTPNNKKENKTPEYYFDQIKEIVQDSELRINENENKTKYIDLRDVKSPLNKEITYLGYRFDFKWSYKDPTNLTEGMKKSIEIFMSDDKFERYKKKIELSFEEHRNNKLKYIGKENATNKLLIKRIRFLTTNTRLIRRKQNVFVGIYFSNEFLSEPLNDLLRLDELLSSEIASIRLSTPTNIIEMLNECKFSKGFMEKSFTKFNPNSFEKIISVWKTI